MARSGGRRGAEEAEEGDERWLVSFADMMTLLMALFLVLFSISSVNKSKIETLQRSLQDAFSGRVLPGGKGIADAGGQEDSKHSLAPPVAELPNAASGGKRQSAKQEAEDFKQVKRKVDEFARANGLSGKVATRITRDGLLIRLLTDKLLFDSGSAAVKPQSAPLLGKLGAVLGQEASHPILVKGHTDDQPIASSQFPSNWELSAARASAVVRTFITDHVSAERLTPSGRADQDPITENDTEAGRAVNRRVEILLPRQAKEGPVERPQRTIIPKATEGRQP